MECFWERIYHPYFSEFLDTLGADEKGFQGGGMIFNQ
jgi:hypothetical protein